VSGWGRIDVIRVAARHGDDIVWTLADAAPGVALRADALELAAVNASGTVTLRFSGLFVPEDRVITVEPYEQWRARDREGLRLNGSHALGVATRCLRLLGEAATMRAVSDVNRARDELDAATVDTLPLARARASQLAMRCAERLAISGGGGSILVTSHAQRLAREALFLLVFGQTRAIRAQQLAE
jgi:alkylation response protein AidB-like acyl-CoA dehydrogenase